MDTHANEPPKFKFIKQSLSAHIEYGGLIIRLVSYTGCNDIATAITNLQGLLAGDLKGLGFSSNICTIYLSVADDNFVVEFVPHITTCTVYDIKLCCSYSNNKKDIEDFLLFLINDFIATVEHNKQ